MQLASLRKIMLDAKVFLLPLMFVLITTLVSLEELSVESGSNEDSKQRILRALRDNDFCFRQSLKILELSGCGRKEKGLETVLFIDILPRFPNLHELQLQNNEIKSLQMIASRIKLESTTDEMAIPDNCAYAN